MNEHETDRDKCKIFYGKVVHCENWAMFAIRFLKTNISEKEKLYSHRFEVKEYKTGLPFSPCQAAPYNLSLQSSV